MTADQTEQNALRVVVLVSGRGTNLQAIIDATRNGQLDIDLCGVVSDRPDAYGLTRAQNAGVSAITVAYAALGDRDQGDDALNDTLTALEPGLIVLAGFMRILPASIVERFHGRMLNIHPSLLPKYRGLNTYQRVLDAGDHWHGSTVHFVTPELDAGPSIMQYRITVGAGDNEASLKQRVQRGEYLIYPRVIGLIADQRLKLYEDGVVFDGNTLDGPIIVDETAVE